MCLVKKPKVAAAPTDKDPAIITNPYLDGLPAIERARTGGVRSLTIPRGASGSASVAPTTPRSPTIPAPATGGGSATTDPAMTLLAKLPGTTGSLARKALSKAK